MVVNIRAACGDMPRRATPDAAAALVGGCLWITLLVYAGYLFGNIPWVKDNLSLIVVAIVVVSLIPAVTTFIRERRAARAAAGKSTRLG